MDALLTAFARHLGLPPEAARPALDVLLDALREALDAEGAGTLDGVGRFYRRNGTVAFEPDPTLLAAINAPFAGLPPVAPAAPPPPPVAVAPPTPEEVPAPAEGEPEETDTTSALFTVPLEPGAPVEDDDEQAAPALDAPEPERPRTTAEATDTPIAPIPTAPTITSSAAEAPEASEEDAFAAPEEIPVPTPAPEPPLRDLSSKVAGEPPVDEEATPLEAPIAVPFAPADALDEAPPAEAAPEAEGLAREEETTAPEEAAAAPEDDLDALIAGVWAPSEPPAPDHPLGAASEPVIEDAEYDLVGEPAAPTAPTEEPAPPTPTAVPPDEAVPGMGAARSDELERGAAERAIPPRFVTPPIPSPAVEPGGPTEAAPAPAPAPASRAGRERRRTRSLGLWLLLLVVLVALAAVFLWPRLGGDGTDEAAVTPSEPSAPVATLPDSAARAEAPEGEAPARGDTTRTATPPPGAAAEDGAEGAPVEPTPPTAEAPPEPEPDAGIPAPLRGPGGVDPARGGATWVLGSGSRAGAARDAERYRQQGYRADVLTGTSGGHTVHRVVVGQFASFEEAQRYRSALPPGAPTGAWVLRLE